MNAYALFIAYNMAIHRCLQILEAGGIVALPTDTLYGVVTLMSHSDKLYKLKRRNPLKPLGLFLSNVREVQRFILFNLFVIHNKCY